jgi:molybdopterin-guanine dinucleotide biosynthesis protein A
MYANKIRIIDKSNSGESDSVSVGFREAIGDLLLVVSADDPLFTEKLFTNIFEQFDQKGIESFELKHQEAEARLELSKLQTVWEQFQGR